MSFRRALLGIVALAALLVLGACGSLSRTGAESDGYEVEITDLPEECGQSRKDALAISIYIDNGHDVIGPFGANQVGTSIKRVFNKNSVDGASVFLETNKCQPLRFCVRVSHISDACAAALSAALGKPIAKDTVLCTGYINPSPCGEWTFDYTDLK